MMNGIDIDERNYQGLVRSFPEVLNLVEELDLVNPRTGLRYGVQANPEERRKLVSIAQDLLNRGRVYSSEQVISLIESRFKISRQRAINGFEKMISQGVLTTFSGQGIRLSI